MLGLAYPQMMMSLTQQRRVMGLISALNANLPTASIYMFLTLASLTTYSPYNIKLGSGRLKRFGDRALTLSFFFRYDGLRVLRHFLILLLLGRMSADWPY